MTGNGTRPPQKPPQKPWMLGRLPTFPPVSARLLYLVGQDDADLREVAEVMQSDPAFSAEVLRIANSPLIGGRYQVGSVLRAISMIGVDRLCNLVWTSFLSGFVSLVPPIESLRRCWVHSLAVALISERLAPGFNVVRSLAYTLGLLHDIGRFALIAAHPKEYAKMLEVASEYTINILSFERELFEVNHCQAGCWLVEKWAFPPDFRIVTRDHHNKPERDDSRVLCLVRQARTISDQLGLGDGGDGSPMDVRGLSAEAREMLTPAALEDIRTHANLLEVGLWRHNSALRAQTPAVALAETN
jgi:HD-like signal output (HDOD) protein